MRIIPLSESRSNDVYDLKGHQLQLGFLKLIKGAPIREQAEEYGYVYREKAPYEIISSKYISAEALMRLKKIENLLDLYYNRGGFGRTVDFAIDNLAGSPFDFYEELADYFYLKGFQHKSHKKRGLISYIFTICRLERKIYTEYERPN